MIKNWHVIGTNVNEKHVNHMSKRKLIRIHHGFQHHCNRWAHILGLKGPLAHTIKMHGAPMFDIQRDHVSFDTLKLTFPLWWASSKLFGSMGIWVGCIIRHNQELNQGQAEVSIEDNELPVNNCFHNCKKARNNISKSLNKFLKSQRLKYKIIPDTVDEVFHDHVQEYISDKDAALCQEVLVGSKYHKTRKKIKN